VRAVLHPVEAPFFEPQEPYGAVDLDLPEWREQSSPGPADLSAAQLQGGKFRQPEQVGLTQEDIERALRILRQSRR
jgi:hypothetical protein